jgi:hypothetical protein
MLLDYLHDAIDVRGERFGRRTLRKLVLARQQHGSQ